MKKTKDEELYAPEDLAQAVETLRRGGIILYPTDTVWGIGCDATNEEAVRRIYELKQRADSKSMLVLIDETYPLESIVGPVPDVAYDLMELAVRPITIIYQGAKGVAPSLLGEGQSLGIRQSREKFSSALCRRLRRPIVSTLRRPSSTGLAPRSARAWTTSYAIVRRIRPLASPRRSSCWVPRERSRSFAPSPLAISL